MVVCYFPKKLYITLRFKFYYVLVHIFSFQIKHISVHFRGILKHLPATHYTWEHTTRGMHVLFISRISQRPTFEIFTCIN